MEIIHTPSGFFLDQSLIGPQIRTLYSFARSLVYHRTIRSHADNISEESITFWNATSDDHIEIAIIRWCNIFGRFKDSKIHWRRFAPKEGVDINGNTVDNLGYESTIRTMLSKSIGTSNKKLTKFTGTVIRFRNNYSAHYDPNNLPEAPVLDKTLTMADTYLKWLIDELWWKDKRQKYINEMLPVFEKECLATLEMSFPEESG